MTPITDNVRQEVSALVYAFLAEEFDKSLAELREGTRIIEDLDGDSLLFVELLQLVKGKYQLDVTLQVIGKYMLQRQPDTIGQVVELMLQVIEHGNAVTERALH